jgi:hypothetical protein
LHGSSITYPNCFFSFQLFVGPFTCLSFVNFVMPLFYITSKGEYIFFIQKPQPHSYYPNQHSFIKVAKELLKGKRHILPCKGKVVYIFSPSTCWASKCLDEWRDACLLRNSGFHLFQSVNSKIWHRW